MLGGKGLAACDNAARLLWKWHANVAGSSTADRLRAMQIYWDIMGECKCSGRLLLLVNAACRSLCRIQRLPCMVSSIHSHSRFRDEEAKDWAVACLTLCQAGPEIEEGRCRPSAGTWTCAGSCTAYWWALRRLHGLPQKHDDWVPGEGPGGAGGSYRIFKKVTSVEIHMYIIHPFKFTYSTIHLKCKLQWFISVFRVVYPSSRSILEHVYHLEKKPCTLQLPPPSFPPRLQATTHLLSVYRLVHSRHSVWMKSCNGCFFVAGFLYIAECFQGSSVL